MVSTGFVMVLACLASNVCGSRIANTSWVVCSHLTGSACV
jgi:hypothetical protein